MKLDGKAIAAMMMKSQPAPEAMHEASEIKEADIEEDLASQLINCIHERRHADVAMLLHKVMGSKLPEPENKELY